MSQGFGRRDLNPRVTATVSTPYKSEPIQGHAHYAQHIRITVIFII